MRWLLVMLALAGCEQALNVGKVAVVGGPAAATEAYCAIADDDRCGEVYACATEADNEIGLVEICISDSTDIEDAEEQYGPCGLSPHQRFDALGHRCYWHCPSGEGCNSYGGCFGCEP